MSSAIYAMKTETIGRLIKSLTEHGYKIFGPVLRDEAIVYDEISSADNLPIGYTDHQKAGSYRLKKRNDDAIFGYSLGPHSWSTMAMAQGCWK